MKRSALIAGMILLAPVATADAATLSGDALRKAIAGKVVVISVRGHSIPIRFSSNGSMSGSLNGVVGVIASQKSDRGRWWVSGNQLCQKWSNWLEAKSHCVQVSGTGANLSWRSKEGVSGTARISG